ncbi:MAG: aminotransferase class IV [Chloroflexi bacterium]|nr:aminotransferase class IV [Chloroflexota bacterium]
MEEIVYLNGSLVPRSRACVPVYDHGFLYGYALFETVRAYHGRLFRLERHLERLRGSARSIGLSPRLADYDLAGACEAALKANRLEDARLRLTVTRGETEHYPGVFGEGVPGVVVTARPYQPPPEANFQKGFTAVISRYKRLSRSPLAGVKSSNYLLNVLARMEAEAAGGDEALLPDESGHLTEGSISNLFFVRQGGLVTPPLTSGNLPGVTREIILKLAGKLRIKVLEENVSFTGLGDFTEAFLTNSLIEVMPLVRVRSEDGRVATLGEGRPGEVTGSLRAAYRRLVEAETGRG